jgi:hypothetical protein
MEYYIELYRPSVQQSQDPGVPKTSLQCWNRRQGISPYEVKIIPIENLKYYITFVVGFQ